MRNFLTYYQLNLIPPTGFLNNINNPKVTQQEFKKMSIFRGFEPRDYRLQLALKRLLPLRFFLTIYRYIKH